MTNDRYAAEQIVSAFIAEAMVPFQDFELRLEDDRAREVCAWLEDEIDAALKSRTIENEAQAEELRKLRAAWVGYRLVPLEGLQEIADLFEEEKMRVPDWLAAAIAGKETTDS